MTQEFKKYTTNVPLFYRESTAAILGVDNRLVQAGEIVELPDSIATRLLKRGSITAIEEPKPAAKPKAVTKTKTEVNK